MVRAFALAFILGLIGMLASAHFGAVDDASMRGTQAYQFIGRVGETLGRQVQQIVQPAMARTETLAQSPRTIAAFEAGPSALRDLANEVITHSSEVDTVSFHDGSGEILAINTVYPDGTPVPDDRVARVTDRSFTSRSIITDCLRVEVTEPILEFQTTCDITPAYFGSIGLSVASSVPVIRGHQKIGVVSTRLDFSRLEEILAATHDGSFSGLYFVSDEGEYFDEEILAGKRAAPIAARTLREFASARPNASGGVGFIETHEDELVCLLPIPGLTTLEGGSMRILLVAPTEWVLAEARAERREHALWVALCGFALTLSVLLVQHSKKQRKLFLEVEGALARAMEANQSRGEFLANLSHEIRTPMTGIFGYLEQLAEGNLNRKETRRCIESIQHNGDLLLCMINDILDLQSIEEGKIELERRAFDPRSVLEGVIGAHEATARSKGLDLEAQISSTTPSELEGDPVRFQQILGQLVGNAVKFTSKGAIRVRLGYHSASSELVIEVEDSGLGIAEKDLAQIFEPFRQADASVTRAFGGAGLGLAIAHRLAQLHGGDLSVRSELGKGSTFIGTIHAPTAEARPAKPEVAPEWPDLEILVAEDGVDNQALIRHLLELTGAKVTIVEDGAAAVSRALSMHPDLILMDIQMPVLDGEAATRRLRESGFDRPIIAVTAHALDEHRSCYLEAGCNDVLPKPYRRSELYAALSAQLARSPHDPEESLSS